MVSLGQLLSSLRRDAPNAALLLVALVSSVYQAFAAGGLTVGGVVATDPAALTAGVAPETLPSGERVLRDYGGTAVPLKRYERIASASTIADEVLVRIAEPERVIAFTARSSENESQRHLYAGKATIDSTASIEHILALRPDLVIVNTLGNEARKQRLLDAGITVFDLGAMRGMKTLLPNIVSLGWLLGAPERGQQLAAEVESRLLRIAQDVPLAKRKRAIYVGIHGTKLYGGTRGSSYEDVLRGAGLVDAAQEEFEDWPAYTPEELLGLDPELIVTQTNASGSLCRHTQLSRLKVCSGRGRLIEIDPAILGSPGLDIVEAAERLHDAVYGPPRRPAGPAGGPQ